MTRRHHSRKHHAHGHKHKSMRKHKRSMSRHGHGHKHKRSMSRRGHGHGHKHKRSMSRHGHGHKHKSMRKHRHKSRKMGRGHAHPPGDSPDTRPSEMHRNENMDFPDSTALETWRGYNRNNYSQAQWDEHVSAIVDAIENGELDQDSTTHAEGTAAYREMSGR